MYSGKRVFQSGTFKNSLWKPKLHAIFHYSNSVRFFFAFLLSLSQSFSLVHFLFAFIFGKCTSSACILYPCVYLGRCTTRQTCVGSLTVWFDGFFFVCAHLEHKKEKKKKSTIRSAVLGLGTLIKSRTWIRYSYSFFFSFFSRRRCCRCSCTQ